MLSELLCRMDENRRQDGAESTSMVEPGDVRDALLGFDPLWEQLNLWEQERLIRSLIKEVLYDGPSQTVTVGFLSEGIKELCQTDRISIEEPS
jgi:hypothetical protein